MDAVYQHVGFVLLAIQDEINHDVEEALDVLILRVLQEKGKVVYSFVLEPVFAIVSSAIHDRFYLVLLKCFHGFGYSLARYVDSLHNFAAFTLKLLHF